MDGQRQRWVTTAVAGVATMACLVLTGCAKEGNQPAAPAAAPTNAAPTSTSASPTTQAGYPPRTGPTAAQLGVSYPYDLYAHCGVEFATFAGRVRKVDKPVPDPQGTPFARGSVLYLPGTMVLTDQDTIRFTVDEASQVIPKTVVAFHPTTETPPLCQ